MKQRVIKVLDKIESAIDIIQINDLLELKTADELKELANVLKELEQEGIVHITKKNRYILMKNCKSLKTGIIDMASAGYAFCVIPNEEDIYIAKDNLNGAIEQDEVVIDVFNISGKKEGKVIKIIKRNIKNIIGTIQIVNNKTKVIIDNKKINIEIKLVDNYPNLVNGHVVLLKLLEKKNNNVFLACIEKIIGHINDPDIDILEIAYSHGINLDFSKETLEELKSIPEAVSEVEKKDRVDLTNQVVFTIDGEDTKDIDDAISISYENNVYTLGVHIADVTNYVKPNTHLYQDAYEKGTSSYLADRVLPMLPHELSNGICSLNEGVERLTISCVMKIDETGKIIDHDIFKSVIKSRKKMTYTAVNKILMNNEIPRGYEEFVDDLKLMYKLSKILRKRKIQNGYIEFGIDEPKIIQDEKGKCVDILRRVQLEGEKLIEDFMIAANETVATHISNMDLPFIYRVHGTPKEEKITDFLNLIKILNINVNTKNIGLTSKAMQMLLDKISDNEAAEVLASMLLRSMQKAVYSTNNIGHFGLGLKNYTHFTSPIRRFPDLMVHQLLKTYLFNNDLNSSTIDFYSKYLIEVADHSSDREQEAVSAEREVDDMKMAEYMERYINEEYEGIITTVTNFGFYVELPNLVEGLVHISSLKGFYNYVPELLSLISDNKKTKYTIGDKVRIKVVGANKKNRTIDFEVIDGNIK